MRILRATERVASPWKNGGGVTYEIACFPEWSTLDTFGWRISLAEVRHGGPFSPFPGIDRHLAVLEGRLSLAVEGRPVLELSPDSSVISFPGDRPTSAQPLSTLVTDLNVMTRRGQFTSRLTRRTVDRNERLTITSADVIAVIALSPLGVAVADTRCELHPHDALLLSPDDRGPVELHPRTNRNDYFLVEIFATR